MNSAQRPRTQQVVTCETKRELSDKRHRDIQKLGSSSELDAVHAGQQEVQARHYDDNRGRYAREFLKSRELAQELEQRDKQKSLEPGRDREL